LLAILALVALARWLPLAEGVEWLRERVDGAGFGGVLLFGAAYFVVSGIVYLLADGGLIQIDTESTLLLLVLIFGA